LNVEKPSLSGLLRIRILRIRLWLLWIRILLDWRKSRDTLICILERVMALVSKILRK
jgi:hypothetical protein